MCSSGLMSKVSKLPCPPHPCGSEARLRSIPCACWSMATLMYPISRKYPSLTILLSLHTYSCESRQRTFLFWIQMIFYLMFFRKRYWKIILFLPCVLFHASFVFIKLINPGFLVAMPKKLYNVLETYIEPESLPATEIPNFLLFKMHKSKALLAQSRSKILQVENPVFVNFYSLPQGWGYFGWGPWKRYGDIEYLSGLRPMDGQESLSCSHLCILRTPSVPPDP